MKSVYIAPDIEIIEFSPESAVTTSFSVGELDDGGFFSDKW